MTQPEPNPYQAPAVTESLTVEDDDPQRLRGHRRLAVRLGKIVCALFGLAYLLLGLATFVGEIVMIVIGGPSLRVMPTAMSMLMIMGMSLGWFVAGAGLLYLSRQPWTLFGERPQPAHKSPFTGPETPA